MYLESQQEHLGALEAPCPEELADEEPAIGCWEWVALGFELACQVWKASKMGGDWDGFYGTLAGVETWFRIWSRRARLCLRKLQSSFSRRLWRRVRMTSFWLTGSPGMRRTVLSLRVWYAIQKDVQFYALWSYTLKSMFFMLWSVLSTLLLEILEPSKMLYLALSCILRKAWLFKV